MPAPAVYVLAIVGAVAAGFAFKEFVYEPHLAPKIERWAEEFVAKRRARRQRAQAVPVATSHLSDDTTPSKRGKPSTSEDEREETRQSIELENLVAKEVGEWRAEVSRSQTKLRQRGNTAGVLGSSEGSSTAINKDRPPSIIKSPTHILFDPQLPLTPTSTVPSAGATPPPHVSPLRESTTSPSPTTDRTPPSAAQGPLSPTAIPSLSQSYPPDLDHEHGLELLSAPSSRPDSPFLALSPALSTHDTTLSASNYYSFSSPNALSPQNATSPEVYSPNRTLSDLDFLSDFDPLSPRSSVSNIPSEAVHIPGDGATSDISSSSWGSANPRS